MSTYTAMSFREIADRYNQINVIPQTSNHNIGRVIVTLFPTTAKILDMGAGAGRISLSIAKAGAEVTALDIEPEMLRVAREEAVKEGLTLQTVVGDVCQMPFEDNRFDAVFTSNVLHLVHEWKAGLKEAIRVMKPGGLFIQGRDWLSPDSFLSAVRSEFRSIIARLNPALLPTAAAGPQLFQELYRLGGEPASEIIATSWLEMVSPYELLRRMEEKEYNETWQLEEPVFSEAMTEIRHWIEHHISDRSTPQPIYKRFVLYVSRGLK